MKKSLFLLAMVFPALVRGEEPPRRIVSLLPSHTDILAVLGALDRVAGLSDAEDPRLYPRLPRVGGMDISWEALAALEPDLVLADVSHRRHDALFQRLHIPAVYLASTRAQSLEDVFSLVEEIGGLVGEKERASRWVADAARRTKDLDARRQAPPGPLVYFELWPQPLQALGPKSLPGDLLRRLGGRNVVSDVEGAAPLISTEALVRADPDLILHLGVVSGADIAARPGWGGMKAVREAWIVPVNADDFSRAGPRILDAFEALADILERRGAP